MGLAEKSPLSGDGSYSHTYFCRLCQVTELTHDCSVARLTWATENRGSSEGRLRLDRHSPAVLFDDGRERFDVVHVIVEEIGDCVRCALPAETPRRGVFTVEVCVILQTTLARTESQFARVDDP